MKICEFGELEKGKRCRKHAKVAIEYRIVFGKRVCMTGPDETVYTSRVTFRCPTHTRVKDTIRKTSVVEYEKAILAQEEEPAPCSS